MYLLETPLSFSFVLLLGQVIPIIGYNKDCIAQSLRKDIIFPNKEKNTCTDDENIVKHIEDDTSKQTEVSSTNVTAVNATKANCLTDRTYGSVELVNSTRLMELLIFEPGPSNRTRNDKKGKQIPGICVLVLFYARWCVFSSQAAPHFNALPRSFPHIKAVAIDAIKYQSFNTQYGIVGVPTLMLVHNGKPIAKFNNTVYSLESFARFITHFTTLKPHGFVYVTSADFSGPLSSTPSNDTDYCLVMSWLFLAVCGFYFTMQSRWWQQFIELIQNTWRESNAQHEHID